MENRKKNSIRILVVDDSGDAREVIQKTLATVQKIAYLLGENSAESEVTLSSIIESFSPAKIEGDEGGGHSD